MINQRGCDILLIILNENGGYAISKYYHNTDFSIDKKAIQIIDDSSELGKKIISMIPNVKLIYTDGLVTDCEPMSEPEPQDTESDLMQMAIDHEYRLTLLELGITE